MEEKIEQTTEEIIIEQQSETVDYSIFTKADFEELVNKTTKLNFSEQFMTFRKVKPFIEELHENEKNVALNKFLSEGGENDDFEYHGASFYENFEKIFANSKKHSAQEFKDSLVKKESNYKTKLSIIQQIKDLIEKASTGKGGFEKFKSLQDEWKATGPVSHEKASELWANYHAVVNRFYDQRHIAFEILDLDRKHNLQGKLLLCSKVEKLASESNIKKALKDLETFHEEFKHIGPVPKDQQEEIWNRFKAASDKVHENKNNYLNLENERQASNLARKTALIEILNEYITFNSEKTSDWSEKTKEVDAFQEEWKKAGLVNKDKVKELNKIYWDGLKTFYNNKRTFFDALDKEKKQNLVDKTAITEKIEKLLELENMDDAIKEAMELQKSWKLIGHVPLKVKDKSYERFKIAVDALYDKKRGVIKQNQAVAMQQLKEKSDVVESVKSKYFTSLAEIEATITEWNTVKESSGDAYAKLYHSFAENIKNKLNSIAEIPENEKDKLVMKLQIEATKHNADGQKELAGWERKLRKELRDIEDEIAQITNNLAFFERAKNADAIKKEFAVKIAVENIKLTSIKSKLDLLVKFSKA
ncbi:MAG: DUF349 domain-containing protein [Cytophagales bacterium]|nr:MAG: DUF349 domain-containing protein [Cytophagales bacterium]